MNRGIFKKNIIIFTGAGVSAESGIQTFRNSDGLWENHRIEDVATPSGFVLNPQLVWDFYKSRHDQLSEVGPNAAHYAISAFQKMFEFSDEYNVIVITQNVDRLHHESGSVGIIELHGNLHDVKCSYCDYIDDSREFWDEVDIPKCPECGENLRPNIVWFFEPLDENDVKDAMTFAKNCSDIIVIGTSCGVYPAFSIVERAHLYGAKVYECNLDQINTKFKNYEFVGGNSSETVPKLLSTIYLEKTYNL